MSQTHTKQCGTDREFGNELFVYRTAYPYKAELIEILQPRTLVLKRIEGIPYLDAPEPSDKLPAELAKAVAALHQLAVVEEKVLCHWDNQPRNILWDGERRKIWLLDFAEIRLAEPEADLAHLLLFWAEQLDQAAFAAKAGLFLGSYKGPVRLSPERWEKAYRNAVARFDGRRRRHNRQEPTASPFRAANRKLLQEPELP